MSYFGISTKPFNKRLSHTKRRETMEDLYLGAKIQFSRHFYLCAGRESSYFFTSNVNLFKSFILIGVQGISKRIDSASKNAENMTVAPLIKSRTSSSISQDIHTHRFFLGEAFIDRIDISNFLSIISTCPLVLKYYFGVRLNAYFKLFLFLLNVFA